MRILEFSRSCLLEAAPAEVFAFHADPRNIVHVSPPGQSARVLADVRPEPGAVFEVEVVLAGLLRLRWRARWEIVEPPSHLCDRGASPLFAHWEHHHEFAPAPAGGTRQTDRVRYALPGGWLGLVLGATVMRLAFALLFSLRQRKTAAYFRNRRSRAA